MTQQDKTKEELIEDIKRLQARVAELEKTDNLRKPVEDGWRKSRDLVSDVVECKKIEEALRDSKMQFQELFDNMSSGVAIYKAAGEGEDFIFLDINKSGERLNKVKREQILGQRVSQVFPGVKELGLFEIFRQVWKTGQPQHHPVSCYHDGRISLWVENYVYKLPCGEIVTIYNDVTQAKQAEMALRESEEKFRAIFDNNIMGISILDRNYRIIKVNNQIGRLFNKNPSDFVNKECFRELEKRQNICQHCPGTIVMQGAPAAIVETRGVRDDGSIFYVNIRAAATYDRDGKCSGFIELVEDITERKKLEEEVRKRLQELEVFYNASMGREERIVELKGEIERLKKEPDKQ